MGTIGLGDRVHQVDYTIGCPFLAAGDRHPVSPRGPTGDRRLGASRAIAWERIAVEKGLKKKRSGIIVKKPRSRQVDRAKAIAVGQGDGKMPDIAPQTEESGPEQAKMKKKVRT